MMRKEEMNKRICETNFVYLSFIILEFNRVKNRDKYIKGGEKVINDYLKCNVNVFTFRD